MLRECIRYFSITYEHDIWVLSPAEVKFYNLFYAAIALIMAMGSVSRFIVDRPQFLGGSIRERTKILNDSRVLNWLFIMWSVELSSFFGLYFARSYNYYQVALFQNLQYLFILLVVVLYLQQWTTCRKLFSKVAFKYFVPTTIVFLILSYLLGSINLVDYESLNEKVLSKNTYQRLRIVKPTSSIWSHASKYSRSRQLYLGFPKTDLSETDPALFYEHGVEIHLNSLDSIVLDWKSKYSKYQYASLMIQLNIDKSVSMHKVNELKMQIWKTGIHKIGYAVVPEGVKDELQLMYRRNHIPVGIMPMEFLNDLYPNRMRDEHVYLVSHNSSNLVFEGIEMNVNEFKKIVKDIIQINPKYVFQMNYDSNLEFGKFIEMYSSIYSVIKDARNEYSEMKYFKKFDWNTREIKREILKMYPMNIADDEF